MILWPGGRLLSANKKHGEVNLDDLDVGTAFALTICLALASGGSYVIIRGKSNLMFWWREPEVVCPPVSSSLRFVW
jgi:hypothetical protein